ncbi:MAG: hypothetical protein A4E32_00028 [Methanomassiliicoccales archaeon PtaU1.Bin124]|nr:MAG: hypothetical protein A4E32_00028 [Methanomassiliicoccales archaeon PtaU1.Bin124]
MAVHRALRTIHTKGEGDMTDLTDWVAEEIRRSGIVQGVACIMARHTTVAVVIMENEAGLQTDLRDSFERVYPKGIEYQHNTKWGDGNGHSHVRATSLGQTLSLTFDNGAPDLGTWQQIVLIEMDGHGRDRQIVLQLVGD